MDPDLKCNRLTCRRTLTDKAVVTTCSHIFCADCADELFSASQLCPACETHLSEPDDVVLSSLHPSNDYKTSVLSGLSPSTVLEICGRAISFWQYQIHQESMFQQNVMKSVNDKNMQLQKQLDGVVREANAEINLLNGKLVEMERNLEAERRRVREFQDSAKQRDKDYQKLKNHYDKLRKKALFGPDPTFAGNPGPQPPPNTAIPTPGYRQTPTVGAVGHLHLSKQQPQRIVNDHAGVNYDWRMSMPPQQQDHMFGRIPQYREPSTGGNRSERSASADEVENMLNRQAHPDRRFMRNFNQPPQRTDLPAPQSVKRMGFRPARV